MPGQARGGGQGKARGATQAEPGGRPVLNKPGEDPGEQLQRTKHPTNFPPRYPDDRIPTRSPPDSHQIPSRSPPACSAMRSMSANMLPRLDSPQRTRSKRASRSTCVHPSGSSFLVSAQRGAMHTASTACSAQHSKLSTAQHRVTLQLAVQDLCSTGQRSAAQGRGLLASQGGEHRPSAPVLMPAVRIDDSALRAIHSGSCASLFLQCLLEAKP